MPGMDWKDVPSLALPFVYDLQLNTTQIAERRDQLPSLATRTVIQHLQRFGEYANGHTECSLFPAVRDLLTNLTLPNEAQPPPQPANIQNQIVQSPVGAVGSSPNPMMHSPMPPMGQTGPPHQQTGYGIGPNTGPN